MVFYKVGLKPNKIGCVGTLFLNGAVIWKTMY